MTATTTATTTAINNNLSDAVQCGRLEKLTKAQRKKTTLRMRNILFYSFKAIMNWIKSKSNINKTVSSDAKLIKVIVFSCCCYSFFSCYCCCYYVFQFFLSLGKRNFRCLFFLIMFMLLFSSAGTCHKARKKCIIKKIAKIAKTKNLEINVQHSTKYLLDIAKSMYVCVSVCACVCACEK